MSRVGKNPVIIPKDVKVALNDGVISVKGPKGSQSLKLPNMIDAVIENDKIILKVKDDDKNKDKSTGALHGLTRAKVNNLVQGVFQGFQKNLSIVGVGYRAQSAGTSLNLQLGFSHPIEFKLPDGITAQVEKQTLIKLAGIDKELLGEIAAKIRALRPPEPYKGKGIRYSDEKVLRKAGKVAGSGAGAKGGK
ncbi:MAG: 50S ribosomal protein L6 [bacterium]